MKVSNRNQLKATVKSVQVEGLMAKVGLDVAGQSVVSIVTADAVSDLGLKVGDDVTAMIKSTSVSLMK